MRTLVIGAEGQLGSSLVALLGEDAIPATRRDFDVTDLAETRAFIVKNQKIDAVINTTAFHNVVECEESPSRAFAVNCDAVENLASLSKEIGAAFVTFSTDYVFGEDVQRTRPYTEFDAPGPVSVYGFSKLAGEVKALEVNADSLVLRTSGLYGLRGSQSKGGNFVDKRVTDARGDNTAMNMSGEQVLTPTFTNDLANATLQLLSHENRGGGIYHASAQGECSWAAFTQAIFDEIGAGIAVNPVDRGGIDRGVRKPLYGVLENTRLEKLGIRMRPWRDALVDYLKQKGHRE